MILENGYDIESAPLKDKPDDFLEYYKRELAARGWQKTDSGGMADAEWHRYEKSGRYFNFGYYTALGVPGKVLPGGFRASVEHN